MFVRDALRRIGVDVDDPRKRCARRDGQIPGVHLPDATGSEQGDLQRHGGGTVARNLIAFEYSPFLGSRMRKTLILALGVSLLACKKQDAAPAKKTEPKPVKAAKKHDRLSREAFNRLAAEMAVPLFWVKDTNGDGAVQPDELANLWGVPGDKPTDFDAFYEKLVDRDKNGPKDPADEAEKKRRAAVRKELSQGRPTLVHNDFSNASAGDKKIVRLILEAADLIETIHAKQTGAHGLDAKIPADDAASRMVFYRNQGPWCVAPATENDPDCHAIATKPKKVSGMYPAALQDKDKFCDILGKQKNANEIMHQFHIVEGDGAFRAVPYNEAYKAEMTQIAGKLEEAAKHVGDKEKPFEAYLLAAAKAFRDNNWEPADEAWSKMNVNNSKWYLRIGPDEVYFEPCGRKAGFHVSFALINQDSLTWQNKLNPVKKDMEKTLADMAGKPYKARNVSFHMPDFIDIVLNAGDSRSAHGATIGQSLPNWGPVANEGRGRTVAMTNLYTDEDSKIELEKQVKSLMCANTMKTYTRDPAPQIMSTVLHEAAHNLGPAHEYKVKGKTASQIFGGPLASTLEELKAQTSALYFTDWLAAKKIITEDDAKRAHVRDIVWGFGHISRGMYTASGRPKSYSQLAAIQFGHLVAEGAIEWKAAEKAANGTDMGCFELNLDKFPPAIEKLERRVLAIKAKGDIKDAKALIATHVDVDGDKKKTLETITERWLRAPKASFVYAITE